MKKSINNLTVVHQIKTTLAAFCVLFSSTILGVYLDDTRLPVVMAGEIVRIADFESDYIASKTIDVWLPPGYSDDVKYPVIYMHDGRMLFDASTTWNGQEWKVDEVAGQLIDDNTVEPFIIVGIWNAGINRHSEYLPQKPFDSMPEKLQQVEYSRLRGNNKLFNKKVYSDSYLRFIVKELKPYINEKFNTDGKRSFLMGSSMGGLISWYGLMEYPNEFQGSASLSTHWPGNFESEENPLPSYFVSYIETNIERLEQQRVYFDHGTLGLEMMYPAIQSQVDSLFIARNYPEHNWYSQSFKDTGHTEEAWSQRLHIPLTFLLKGEKVTTENQ